MSTRDMQRALNRLIRYPGHFRGQAIESFLKEYSLTESELWQVRALAASHDVKKFGKERQSKRFRYFVRHYFPTTVALMGSETAYKLFCEEFEPAFPSLELGKIAPSFFNFMQQHKPTLRESYPICEVAWDMLAYEYAKYCFHYEWTADWLIPASPSCLKPEVVLKIITTTYDLSPLFSKARSLPESELAKLQFERKPRILAFIRTPRPPEGFHLHEFAIDEKVHLFLIRQTTTRLPALDTRTLAAPDYPECYDKLTELGICFPRSTQGVSLPSTGCTAKQTTQPTSHRANQHEVAP